VRGRARQHASPVGAAAPQPGSAPRCRRTPSCDQQAPSRPRGRRQGPGLVTDSPCRWTRRATRPLGGGTPAGGRWPVLLLGLGWCRDAVAARGRTGAARGPPMWPVPVLSRARSAWPPGSWLVPKVRATAVATGAWRGAAICPRACATPCGPQRAWRRRARHAACSGRAETPVPSGRSASWGCVAVTYGWPRRPPRSARAAGSLDGRDRSRPPPRAAVRRRE